MIYILSYDMFKASSEQREAVKDYILKEYDSQKILTTTFLISSEDIAKKIYEDISSIITTKYHMIVGKLDEKNYWAYLGDEAKEWLRSHRFKIISEN